MNKKQELVIDEVINERKAQDLKWGEQNHHPIFWMTILMEEVGEASKAALECDLTNYREEIIQVAAVAVSMVESLDRWKWNHTMKEKVNMKINEVTENIEDKWSNIKNNEQLYKDHDKDQLKLDFNEKQEG